MKNSLVEKKGFEYSVRTAELIRYLQEKESPFPLSDRLLCCGLKAGMHCREIGENGELQAMEKAAVSCIKEADYIIEMAVYAGYLTERQSIPIRKKGMDLIRLLQEESNEA